MKLNTGPARDWLGHTRGERRATIFLLIVIFMITLIRYGFPTRDIVIERTDHIPLQAGQAPYRGAEQEPEKSSTGSVHRQYTGTNTDTDQSPDPGFSREIHETVPVLVQSGKRKALVDINSCDTAELVALRGIGPVLSARIINYRKLLGGYASVEQLREVYGLPEETFLAVRESLWADTSLVRRTNINTAGYKDLCRIPYLEKYDVVSVLKYRELKGRIESNEELISGKIIDAEKARRASPYMVFDME
jgi:competence protein ComEA